MKINKIINNPGDSLGLFINLTFFFAFVIL